MARTVGSAINAWANVGVTITASLMERNPRLPYAAAMVNDLAIRAERGMREATGQLERRDAIRQAEVARLPRGVHGLAQGGPVITWHEGGSGDPVVLLNGYLASGLVWPSTWVSNLEARHQVIRVDNRTTGWSRRAPTPFTIADLADDVAALLAYKGLRSARVLGLSMGGMVAQELALRHPDLVRQLVLVSTIPPTPANAMMSSRHVSSPDYRLLLGMLLDRVDDPTDGGRRLRAGERMLRFTGTSYRPSAAVAEEMGRQILRRTTPRRLTIEQARAIAAWCGPNRIRNITAPTTVIQGADDPVVLPANGRALARLIPGARYLELKGVGHLAPWEAPDVLVELLDTTD